MTDTQASRPSYQGKWAENECSHCGAKPYESCVWVGIPNERFPKPVGTPKSPCPSRKFYYLDD